MRIGANDEPTPAVGAAVSLKGTGDPVRTVAGGEFRLFLPDQYKPGEDITLIVDLKDYRVFHPVGGATKVPADLDKHHRRPAPAGGVQQVPLRRPDRIPD
jgi:hypothetical protein